MTTATKKETQRRIKIALGDINIDTRLRVRDIDSHKVAVFRDVLSSKNDLPPGIIDQNKVLICGHHRYEAQMKNFPPDQLISMIQKDYESDKERLIDAGRDNQTQGFRLTPFEEKRLAFRLKTMEATEEEISKAIGRPVSKILRWHGDAILVINGQGKKEEKPRKGGIPKSIKTMNSDQYDNMAKKNSGWPLSFHADQIMVNIENKTIDFTDPLVIDKLKELVEIVTRALQEVGHGDK